MSKVLKSLGLFAPVQLIGNQMPRRRRSRLALDLATPPSIDFGARPAAATPPGGHPTRASLPLPVRPSHLSEDLA